jgi:hypothetical protein
MADQQIYDAVPSLPREICGMISNYAESEPHVWTDDAYTEPNRLPSTRVGRQTVTELFGSGCNCCIGERYICLPRLVNADLDFDIYVESLDDEDDGGVVVGIDFGKRTYWFLRLDCGRRVRFRVDLANGRIYGNGTDASDLMTLPAETIWPNLDGGTLCLVVAGNVKAIFRSGPTADRSSDSYADYAVVYAAGSS